MSVNQLKSEVTDLKNRVSPENKQLIINLEYCANNKPHGFLCGSQLHWITDKHGTETKWFEAVDSETELAAHQAYYDELISNPHNKFMKAPDHPFRSFNSFCQYHACKCSRHGVNNDEPYVGHVPKCAFHN